MEEEYHNHSKGWDGGMGEGKEYRADESRKGLLCHIAKKRKKQRKEMAVKARNRVTDGRRKATAHKAKLGTVPFKRNWLYPSPLQGSQAAIIIIIVLITQQICCVTCCFYIMLLTAGQ